jgi:hypothetical protein
MTVHPEEISHDMSTVAVYLTNPEALIPASDKKVHYDITFRTIVLNAPAAGNPAVGSSVKVLCAADLSREYIIVSAVTNDVVLCSSQADAQDGNNAVAGLPNPTGTLLKASTTTLAYPPIRIPTTDLVWVTAASFPAIVPVILVNRVKG